MPKNNGGLVAQSDVRRTPGDLGNQADPGNAQGRWVGPGTFGREGVGVEAPWSWLTARGTGNESEDGNRICPSIQVSSVGSAAPAWVE